MLRAVAALAALIMIPGLASAQEPPREAPAPEEGRHTVERGESLWNLARRYYDDPFSWRRIFEANQSAIDDPHWIYPGQHFQIPGFGSEVTGLDVTQAGETVAGGPVRGLFPGRADPTVFSRPPRDTDVRPSERTAFYGAGEVEAGVRGGVLGSEGFEHLAVSQGDFYSAEWLTDEGWSQFDGRVSGWAGSTQAAERRRTIKPYDRVLVEWSRDRMPREGELLQAVRVPRVEEGLGQVLRPTGLLRVVSRDDGRLVAVALSSYDRMRLDDWVLRAPEFPLEPGQYVEARDGSVRARVRAFANPRPIQQLGDVAFLDVGASDGVSVGDEFALYAGEAGSMSEVGRLKVNRAFQDEASARIVSLVTPAFEPGVEVRLSGKMP